MVLNNINDRLIAARVKEFFRINIPKFLRLQIDHDPKNFNDEFKKIFGVMQMIGNGRVELAFFS